MKASYQIDIEQGTKEFEKRGNMGLEERETGLFVIIKVSKVIIQTDRK